MTPPPATAVLARLAVEQAHAMQQPLLLQLRRLLLLPPPLWKPVMAWAPEQPVGRVSAVSPWELAQEGSCGVGEGGCHSAQGLAPSPVGCSPPQSLP